MTAEKMRLFTIGQFANLHGINKKTLMWYDEVGLFHPAVIRENGYRYYTYFQSTTLQAILLLRELDVPIARIRAFLDDRSMQTLSKLLDEQMRQLDARLAHLKKIRKTLVQKAQQADSLLHLDPQEIKIVTRAPERLILLPTEREFRWEQDTRTLVQALQSRGLGNLYNAGFGAMIPFESLAREDFSDYRHVFLRLPAELGRQGGHKKPGGRYLLAYHLGDVDDLAERYRALLSYCAQQNLRPTGYAYETVLNEMTAPEPGGYLTRIEIGLCDAPLAADGAI